MGIYEFMGQHPILTFFLAGYIAQVLSAPFRRPRCKCKKGVQ
jgi:hypothetical protein